MALPVPCKPNSCSVTVFDVGDLRKVPPGIPVFYPGPFPPAAASAQEPEGSCDPIPSVNLNLRLPHPAVWHRQTCAVHHVDCDLGTNGMTKTERGHSRESFPVQGDSSGESSSSIESNSSSPPSKP